MGFLKLCQQNQDFKEMVYFLQNSFYPKHNEIFSKIRNSPCNTELSNLQLLQFSLCIDKLRTQQVGMQGKYCYIILEDLSFSPKSKVVKWGCLLSMRSNVRKMSSPKYWTVNSVNDVIDYRGECRDQWRYLRIDFTVHCFSGDLYNYPCSSPNLSRLSSIK